MMTLARAFENFDEEPFVPLRPRMKPAFDTKTGPLSVPFTNLTIKDKDAEDPREIFLYYLFQRSIIKVT